MGLLSRGRPSRRRKRENGRENRAQRPLGSTILSDHAASPFSLDLGSLSKAGFVRVSITLVP